MLFPGVNKAWRYVEHGCDLHFSKGKLKADKLNPLNIVGKETLVLRLIIFDNWTGSSLKHFRKGAAVLY